MTPPQNAPGGNEKDPPGHTSPAWLRSLARAVAPPTAEDKPALIRLLRRLTRAQKVIVGLGSLGIVIAVLVAGPPLPPPLSLLQQALQTAMGQGHSGAAGVYGAYRLAVVLQGLVLISGSLILWITLSWRLGRFAPLPLGGFLFAAALFLLVGNRSPTATLWGWIVIAALAIAYIYYYRKGRFGYTRGATAAVFSHLALIAFFLAFPFALIEVLGGDAVTEDVADTGVEIVDEPQVDLTTELPTTGRTESQPTETTDTCEAWNGAVTAEVHCTDGLPPRILKTLGGAEYEVITDATSPEDLRALFDDVFQRQGGDLGDLAHLAEGGDVRIRCASVPELPEVDPTLGIGAFAFNDEDANRRGLAPTERAVFETTDRRDCDPLPPPPGAVTTHAVIAAVQQAGLEVTNPRDGSAWCHERNCLQIIDTDQLTITVWPTAQAAQDWLAPPSIVEGAEPVEKTGVLFGPVTTALVSASNASYLGPRCQERFDDCIQTYVDQLTAIAFELEQAGEPDSVVAGAELIGGGGLLRPGTAREGKLAYARLVDVDLDDAIAVAGDGNGGLWILADYYTVLHSKDGQVDLVRTITRPANGLTVGPSGEPAVSAGQAVIELGIDPTSDRLIDLSLPPDAQVGDLAVTGEGTILIGDTALGRIDAITPDGGIRHVLSVAQDEIDSEVEVDQPLGQIGDVVALPDGHVAFVTWNDSMTHLRVLDGGGVRTIEIAPQDGDRQIGQIFPASASQLLAIFWADGTHPQIALVDVDTGQTDVIADLEGTEDGAWSATADGNDVVFLANDRLWRLPNMLTSRVE